jgi:hypothetical protein
MSRVYRGEFVRAFDYLKVDNISRVVDLDGFGTNIFLKREIFMFGKIGDCVIVTLAEHRVIEAFVDAWGFDWLDNFEEET